MQVYYYSLLFCIIFRGIVGAISQHCSWNKKTEIKISLFVISTVLALVAGFRGPSVGADTGTYVELFDDVSLIKQEPGFRALCEAIHLFTDSSTVFQIVCAYIINGGMAIACYRLSQKPFMSMTLWVLFFYYFASFNGTRQYIAIVILVNSFYYASKKRWIAYTFCQLLALSFHSSAFVGILYPVIFALDNGVRKHRYVVVFVTLVLVSIPILWERIEPFIIRYMPTYGFYLTSKLTNVVTGGGIRQLVMNFCITAAFFFLQDRNVEVHRKYDAVLIIAVVLSGIQMWMQAFDRFLWYFEVFSIITIPEVLRDDNSRLTSSSKQVFAIAILAVGFLFMSYYFMMRIHGVVPYVFYIG